MGVDRLGHTATRLPDGRVLVTGGLTCCKITPDSVSLVATDIAEVYDPETDQFETTGSLAAARSFHTATLLPDGRVLIAGGLFGDDANPSPAEAEIYDPSSGKFSAASALQVPRGNHSAVLLTDGRVLLVGGNDAGHPFVGLQTTEVYDPAANEWSSGPVLRPAWTDSTVTLLGNGKVLIFGGETPQGDPVSNVILFE
jgi:N-acetylneuraminic acid mutarotase